MINDKYRIQTPYIKFNPVTLSSTNQPNNPNSIIYSNISPIASVQQFSHYQSRLSGYQSESTIRSTGEEDALLINAPNYAVYASIGGSGEEEKILINKKELVSFTQCFAQEKIQLQNQLSLVKTQNQQLFKEIQHLKQQNTQLHSSPSQSSHPHPHLQQLQSLKSKLKHQFQKRMSAQKQYHTQQAIAFQLKKKNQFLQQKLKYQQQQVNRCQQLIKIKEDIIQNFQWEKTVSVSKIMEKTDKFGKQSRANLKVDSSPVTKYNNHKDTRVTNRDLPRTEINQTLDLTEINLTQHNNRTLPQENQNSTKKISKYAISKKPSQHNNGSKKKLNVSLQKSSKNSSLTNIDIPKTIQKEESRGKIKSIVIKRNVSSQEVQFEGEDEDKKERRDNNLVIDRRMKQLQRKLQQSIQHYQGIISTLKRQFSVLNNQLNQLSNLNTNLMNESSMLKSTKDKSHSSTVQKDDIEKKYNLLRQKCILLQNQIQKTIRKYLSVQQRYDQLEKLVESLYNNSHTVSQCREYQQPLDVEVQITKPGLSLRDLVTPQFRDTKLNSNFFAKNKDDNNSQKLFQNIEIRPGEGQEDQRKMLLDTFEKKMPMRNNFNVEDNVLEVSKNQMEDVSEIVCRNEEELAIAGEFEI